MPRVVFVLPDGSRRTVDGDAGLSVMETARANGIDGVVARCGGACACGTCHVVVDEAWRDRLAPPEEMELGMLESVFEPCAGSRLGCQIELTDDLDGLTVRVPRRQAD